MGEQAQPVPRDQWATTDPHAVKPDQTQLGGKAGGPKVGLLVAGGVAVVGGLLLGILALNVLGGEDDPQAGKSGAPSSSRAQTTAPAVPGEGAPEIPASQIRAAAPRKVRMVADQGTSVNLRWQVPRISAELPILIQVAPAGDRPIISVGNGTANAAVDQLTPGTRYCFKVGAMLRSAAQPGGRPVIAWSSAFCIRDA